MRHVLDPMLVYFDSGHHWAPRQGLAMIILSDMSYLLESEGILIFSYTFLAWFIHNVLRMQRSLLWAWAEITIQWHALIYMFFPLLFDVRSPSVGFSRCYTSSGP